MTQEEVDGLLATLRRPPITEREKVRAALFAAMGGEGHSGTALDRAAQWMKVHPDDFGVSRLASHLILGTLDSTRRNF